MKNLIRRLKKIYVYLFWFLPDSLYIRISYFLKIGKFIDLKNPKTFNEKINWLKLNDKNELLHIVTDKYLVREYVKEKIGDNILVPLLWVGDDPKDIPFENLPDSFVIKCNDGSGKNIIVKDKNKIDRKKILKQIQKWMKSNFSYKFARERCYKHIKRKVIVEKYLGTEDALPVDYKFFMSNGKFILLEYCFNRSFHNQRIVEIEYLDTNLRSYSLNSQFIKPENFDKMLDLAEKLSKGFSFVRVDFYNIKGKIYFGEMTLYPSGGWKVFPNKELDLIVGQKIKI